tara:strand:+ start:336 stop:647 length:312 start_codon:yes stop_codon:yes gene_type:complete
MKQRKSHKQMCDRIAWWQIKNNNRWQLASDLVKVLSGMRGLSSKDTMALDFEGNSFVSMRYLPTSRQLGWFLRNDPRFESKYVGNSNKYRVIVVTDVRLEVDE